MKTLQTFQQTELRELLEKISQQDVETQAQINYWVIELKPKRIRKIVLDNNS